MTETTKTLLIVGGVAVAAYLLYKNFTAAKTTKNPITGGGGSQSVSAATGQGASGSASFWSTLGNVGQGLNSATSSVESTYNNVYDLFGSGSPTTSGTNASTNG